MLSAVQHAISSMHERYFDPITVNDLAAEVFVSPFHFSRMFAKVTGVTPGRYLTAVRLFEAKRLLLTTSLTVSDIVCSVGYSSVGTFTSRFTQAVGMTPTQYRSPEVGQLLVAVSPGFQRLPALEALRNAGVGCARPQSDGGSIVGRIEMPTGSMPATVLVGVFPDMIPQRGPVAFKGMPKVGSTELIINNVPDGRWVVIAAAEHQAAPGVPTAFSLGMISEPVTISAGAVANADIRMRALQPTDPPIAFTLAGQGSPTVPRQFVAEVRGLRAVA
ncbi:AraC family transcriptional regulator [Amycolatopsis antarctica]|uniref:AraC family transcriptional regulator n=1 Tax=Amycolatopsis antarctica TaxID=1854586 RepID=A0A263D2R8_9PSEU|nr:helix-turn-helix transcriptional regulator [Amycolatopsis antarctica]OZM71927.1 AraC family transcriptional regulator [Amycolatopsis antarctica]